MGLFDKKFCDICGEKIGFLGNRKLADGNMCKDCAKLISPFLTGRRQFTLADMKEHLAYREANKALVADFHPTKVINGGKILCFDEDKKQFLVTSSRNWRSENPDVMDFSQVTGCDLDVKESRSELYRSLPDGKRESYNPPRYEYSYDFNMSIFINSPWFDRIDFRVNEHDIRHRGDAAYREAEAEANEIKSLLTELHDSEREAIKSAAAPKKATVCSFCGATTTPDAKGCCEYCGAPLN